jgi:hypothetical protein
MNQQKFRLSIELVPLPLWQHSLFRIYKENNQLNKWKSIKKELIIEEGQHCWICGNKGGLEAHEFWEYDDINHIQKLVAIHHLCSMCHKIKHIGFWCYTKEGKEILFKSNLSKEDLINHFCKINQCSKEDFESHEKTAFALWRERNKYVWKQDFGKYNLFGQLDENRKATQ